LDDILAEHTEVHAAMMQAIETLADEDLNDPARIAGMPPEWRLSQLIADNTYRHYPEHAESIRQWLVE
jgi:hypothetical protein